jgi:uncharacterized membrane protein YoaT (DUF817 family)
MKTRRYIIIVSITALLLLIPFIGMQFTKEIRWTLLDFVIAAALLMLTGITLKYILENIKRKSYKIILSLGVFIILILVWIELAVGIF